MMFLFLFPFGLTESFLDALSVPFLDVSFFFLGVLVSSARSVAMSECVIERTMRCV